MRTRRSRGLKQTRKGGKDTKDNRSNWERFWRNQYPDYDPMMNYPGRAKTFFKATPNEFKKLTTPNTYIIQRHGFSCANLEKANKNSRHFRVADPSLTAYGIYSLIRDQRKPEGFDGTIFVSSLVRTWQTGILEYGRHGPLMIVVSPYIKEKHGIVGDLSNMPLPFEQQMAQMGEFMTFLKGIDKPIAKEITDHTHVIVYMGQAYPLTYAVLGREGKEYVDELKRQRILTVGKSTKPTLTKEVFIPEISVIPHASLREYYGAKGFVYFDHWIRKHYPHLNTIFVVSHSGWMQKVIEEYWGVLGTKIFDENAWKLKITPGEPGNFTFEIICGIPKPKPEELDDMNSEREPTCYLVPRPWPRPEPLSSDPREYAERFSAESTEDPFPVSGLEDLASDPLSANKLEDLVSQSNEDPLSANKLEDLASQPNEEPAVDMVKDVPPFPRLVVNPFPRPLSPDDPRRPTPKLVSRPRAESLSNEADPVRPSKPSLHTEAIPVVSDVKTVPVTNEKTEVVTRSYTELVHMLCDRSLANGLNTLMASNTDFKTKVVNYMNSNPYVMVSDLTDTSYFKRKIPIYLFENHYLIFILFCKPYFYQFVTSLETNKDDTFTKSILSLFNLSVPIPVIVSFLKQLQQIIEDDPEVYHLLLSICSRNANKHYAFKENRLLLSQTLLDLLFYELQVFPVTPDNIEFMYTCIIDLIRYGARCSSIHYSQEAPRSFFEKATGIEIPSAVIVPFKMPIVELELLPKENEILQTWESEKRALDPNGILSQYQHRFTDAKRRLRTEERKVQVLYNKANNQIEKLQEIHDDFLTRNNALFTELDQIKKEYRAARASIDPDNRLLMARKEMHRTFDQDISSYLNLNPRVVDHLSDPIVIRMHNDFFQKFIKPEFAEPSVSIGGSKGTSWKRSSLRQSSVKAGRYRASLYKGKRRTRANRS